MFKTLSVGGANLDSSELGETKTFAQKKSKAVDKQ